MQASESAGSRDPSENTWPQYIKETVLPKITTSSISERTQFLHLLLVRIKRKGRTVVSPFLFLVSELRKQTRVRWISP